MAVRQARNPGRVPLGRPLGPAYRDRISTVRRVGYRYVPDHR